MRVITVGPISRRVTMKYTQSSLNRRRPVKVKTGSIHWTLQQEPRPGNNRARSVCLDCNNRHTKFKRRARSTGLKRFWPDRVWVTGVLSISRPTIAKRRCSRGASHDNLVLGFFTAKRIQRLFNQSAPKLSFFGERHRGISDDVDDTVAQHQAICPNHFCDRQSRRDLHRRDTCLFEFRRNRSAAARAGSSRRREDDRVDAQVLGFLCHLATHPAGIRQRIRQA